MTTLDTPETIRDIIDAVGSPMVRVNFDPVNLLGDLSAVYASGDGIRHMWDVIGPRYVPSAHLKDVLPLPHLVVHLAEVAPGKGLLEHLPADEVDDAIRFAIATAGQNGISFAGGGATVTTPA